MFRVLTEFIFAVLKYDLVVLNTNFELVSFFTLLLAIFMCHF